MENATEAFKMAGSVFMFLIALSVAIAAFSQARATSDVVLAMRDRETSYIDGNKEYYYLSGDGENRTVSVETIIPAIYRSTVENYKIVFDFNGENYWIYKYKDKDSNWKTSNTIDSEIFSNYTAQVDNKEFWNGLLYYNGNELRGIQIENKYNIKLNSLSLYRKIKDLTFTESQGIYYQEDLLGTNHDNTNKTMKKVITYKEI